MKKALLVLAFALAASATAVVADAGNPRAENKQLRKADMRFATRALLTRGDLGVGWRATKPSPFDQDDGTGPACQPDVSRFTITGRAHSKFKGDPGAEAESEVDVFESVSDARGDFHAGSGMDLAKCGKAIEKVLPGARLVSSRKLLRRRIGERTFRYRIVVAFHVRGRRIVIYIDAIAFQRGRSIGFVSLTNIDRPLAGGDHLAELMLARMRA